MANIDISSTNVNELNTQAFFEDLRRQYHSTFADAIAKSLTNGDVRYTKDNEASDCILQLRKRFGVQRWVSLKNILQVIECEQSHTTKTIKEYEPFYQLIPKDILLQCRNIKIPTLQSNIKYQIDTRLTELVSNALDASNQTLIGKFGSGFMSTLNLLYSGQASHIRVLTKKLNGNIVNIHLTLLNGEIRAGTSIANEEAMAAYIGKSGTLIQITTENTNTEELIGSISKTFAVCTSNDIIVNGESVNKIDKYTYLKDPSKDTDNALPIKVDIHGENIFIRDYGIGMDEETVLTKLIYPKAGTKRPRNYTTEELYNIIQQETNYAYGKGEDKNTIIQFQIAGVIVKEVEVPKQGNIDNFTLILPSITYLPESRNEIKLTQEVFGAIQYTLESLAQQNDLQQTANVLGCVSHIIRTLDISEGPAANKASTLKKLIQTKLLPALQQQAEKEGKVLVQANEKLQKYLTGENIVYIDAFFVPKLQIEHIPGVEPLQNVIESPYNLLSPRRYCSEFDPSSDEDVIVFPDAILVNKKYIHTDFQHSVINNLANFSNAYELKEERPRNGFIVSTKRRNTPTQDINSETNEELKNNKEHAQLVYTEIINQIDEHFDNLWSEGVKTVLRDSERQKKHIQRHILEPFDWTPFLKNADTKKNGMYKVLWHLVTQGSAFEQLAQDKELEDLFAQTCQKLRGAVLKKFFLIFWSMATNVLGNVILIAPELKHLLRILLKESENNSTLNNMLSMFERFDKPIHPRKNYLLGRHIFQELIHYKNTRTRDIDEVSAQHLSIQKTILALEDPSGSLLGSYEYFPGTNRSYAERLILLLKYYISTDRKFLRNHKKIENTLKSYFGINYDLQKFANANKDLLQSMNFKSLKKRRKSYGVFYRFKDKLRDLNQKGKTMFYKYLLNPEARVQDLNKELEKMQYHIRGDTEHFNRKSGYKRGRRKKGEKKYDRAVNFREDKPIDIEDIMEAPRAFLQKCAQLEQNLLAARIGTKEVHKKIGGYFEPLSLWDYHQEYIGIPIYENTGELLYKVLSNICTTTSIHRNEHHKTAFVAEHFGIDIEDLENFVQDNKQFILDMENIDDKHRFEIGYLRSMCRQMTEKGKIALMNLVYSPRGLNTNKIINNLQDPSYWIEGKAIFMHCQTNKPARWMFKHYNHAKATMLLKLEQLLIQTKIGNIGKASDDSLGISFTEYCKSHYPSELTNMIELLSQKNNYLDMIELQTALKKKKTSSIRLSEINFLYNNYNDLLANIRCTKHLKDNARLLKKCNHAHYHQTIRSTIDGQDRGSMIFLRELVQNARDAIISSKQTSEQQSIDITFGQQESEIGKHWVTRVQDPVGMDFNHIIQYLLPINVSSKSSSDSVGMYGQGFYSCALGAKEIGIKTSCGDGITSYWKITPIRQSGENTLNNQIIDFTIEWQEVKEEFKGTIIERVAQLEEGSAETLGTIGSHFLHKYIGGIQDITIRFNGKVLNTKAFSTTIKKEEIAPQNTTKCKTTDPQHHKAKKQELSLVIRSDYKPSITKDNLFVSEMDPLLIEPFPNWIKELIYKKGRSFDLPSNTILNKTRNAVMDKKKVYPRLQISLRPLLIKQILILVCQESFAIPMLPEDYFYNTDYKHTESQDSEVEDHIQAFNQGDQSYQSRSKFAQDNIALSQFLTGVQFELDGSLVTLRELRDKMSQGRYHPGLTGRIVQQVKAHEKRKERMNEVLKNTKNKKFSEYEDMDHLSRALGIKKTKIIAFFRYCDMLAKKIGVQANRGRRSFDGQPGRAEAYRDTKDIIRNTDNIDDLKRLINGFGEENSPQHQSLINTVVHECTHLIEGNSKRGTHESDKEEEQSFSKLMIMLLTKLLRTTGE